MKQSQEYGHYVEQKLTDALRMVQQAHLAVIMASQHIATDQGRDRAIDAARDLSDAETEIYACFTNQFAGTRKRRAKSETGSGS
jgi:hypothetical protein